MKTNSIKPTGDVAEGDVFLGEYCFDPLGAAVRARVRGFIEELLEAELDAALARKRYEGPSLSETAADATTPGAAGHRERQLMGTFGPVSIRVRRARLGASDFKAVEWKNATIPAYQRRAKQVDALIAGAYLAGTNTRRVRRALAALFGGALGKNTVSRVWRKVKRGLKTPELVIVDNAADLQKALAALWSDAPVQRCTIHKHRNLLAHAPDRLHDEISADYNDMISADAKQEMEAKRKAFIRKWRLKCRAVADSLEEAGDKLFTFTRFPKSQWRSIRTSNAIERLHEEFKRRITTQNVLPLG
jgi:transposase-like protein